MAMGTKKTGGPLPLHAYHFQMRKPTAILHRGEPSEGGYWATCLEVPGANGQGETREECLRDLAAAVDLILV
jgi:predicted RNase H-like HicB family nuclease